MAQVQLVTASYKGPQAKPKKEQKVFRPSKPTPVEVPENLKEAISPKFFGSEEEALTVLQDAITGKVQARIRMKLKEKVEGKIINSRMDAELIDID